MSSYVFPFIRSPFALVAAHLHCAHYRYSVYDPQLRKAALLQRLKGATIPLVAGLFLLSVSSVHPGFFLHSARARLSYCWVVFKGHGAKADPPDLGKWVLDLHPMELKTTHTRVKDSTAFDNNVYVGPEEVLQVWDEVTNT